MHKYRPLILCGLTVAAFALGVTGCRSLPRKLLYFPSHEARTNGLAEWRIGDRVIGVTRIVSQPKNVWLLTHGNAGQAADRSYALPAFAADDSIYILEYPGYGLRSGSPSEQSFNSAAREAYDQLRREFPHTPVCAVGESIGTGPASWLGTLPHPPDKIVLIVPFDNLAAVAKGHYPFLPVGLLLPDNWDNVASLKAYDGPVEIFAAKGDTVIPPAHARALAASKAGAKLHEFDGGHNDWSHSNVVRIRNP
jgi:pimeloyl-ACP methyl ester carboxylesterase